MLNTNKYWLFNNKVQKKSLLVFFLYFFIIIINSNLIAHPEEKAPADTVKKIFPNVSVYADRLLTPSNIITSAYSMISRDDLNKIGAVQVSDALSYYPGILIKDYGGLGGLKTVSIRGTSSQQTLIMIDGMRLNSTQSGLQDLSALPAYLVEGIEILRGGASAVFGGNAIGGIVNLRTDFSKDSSQLRGKLGYGSFGEYSLFANSTLHFNDFSLAAGLVFLNSDGDYPIELEQYGRREEIKRKNSDFQNLSLLLGSKLYLGSWRLNSRLILRNTDRGVPGAVLQGSIESPDSRLNEYDGMFILSGIYPVSGDESIFIGGMARINGYNYNDSTGFIIKSNDFINRNFQMTARYSRLMDILLCDFNSDAAFSDLRGDMLQPETGSYVKRSSFSIAIKAETKLNIGTFLNIIPQIAFRWDAISDAGNALSPLVGAVFAFTNLPFSIISQWSMNFRPPCFNEMYYLNYGTAILKPEKGESVNLGIRWQPYEYIELEADAFTILTRNEIVAVPKSPIAWSAQNIGEVLTRGFELSASAEFFNNMLALKISYTRQIASDESCNSQSKGKKIIYIPQELIGGMMNMDIWDYILGCLLQYSSYRYTQSDNAYISILPSYAILSLFLNKKIKIDNMKYDIRIECNNIFDERYMIIKSYPMPGRSFRAGISYEL